MYLEGLQPTYGLDSQHGTGLIKEGPAKTGPVPQQIEE
jgi:hypothetical protein